MTGADVATLCTESSGMISPKSSEGTLAFPREAATNHVTGIRFLVNTTEFNSNTVALGR